MNTNKHRLIAAIKIALAGTGILLVAGWFWVSSTISVAPTAPRPETGNVVPFNNHGKTVYVTKFEDQFVVWCPVGIAVLILVGALSNKWISSKD